MTDRIRWRCTECDRIVSDAALLRAEVARLTAENDWLRAYTGQSAKACIYCGLGADEQGKCNRGFPGCARADDQMLCREVDVALERDELRAEVVSLREQIAALESREVCTAAHENTETCGYCQRDALAQDEMDGAMREGGK